jgi:DnaJ-class molecular chaperone
VTVPPTKPPPPQCPTCKGLGYIWVEHSRYGLTPERKCPDCNGSGSAPEQPKGDAGP